MEIKRTDPAAQEASGRPFVVLGILWLLLAVAVVASQVAVPKTITVEWETETEVDTAGFNVYRSQSPDGGFRRLNEGLVPAQGSAVSGAGYRFVDRDVEGGQTYYYRLEDVDLDNTTEMHEVLPYTAPAIGWWVLGAAVASAVFGLLLVVKGLR